MIPKKTGKRKSSKILLINTIDKKKNNSQYKKPTYKIIHCTYLIKG